MLLHQLLYCLSNARDVYRDWTDWYLSLYV